MLSHRNNSQNTEETRKSLLWATRSSKENWSLKRSLVRQIFQTTWLFRSVIISPWLLIAVKHHLWRQWDPPESLLIRCRDWERRVDLRLKIKSKFSTNFKMRKANTSSRSFIICRTKLWGWWRCLLLRNSIMIHLLMRNWWCLKSLNRKELNLQFRFTCKRQKKKRRKWSLIRMSDVANYVWGDGGEFNPIKVLSFYVFEKSKIRIFF